MRNITQRNFGLFWLLVEDKAGYPVRLQHNTASLDKLPPASEGTCHLHFQGFKAIEELNKFFIDTQCLKVKKTCYFGTTRTSDWGIKHPWRLIFSITQQSQLQNSQNIKPFLKMEGIVIDWVTGDWKWKRVDLPFCKAFYHLSEGNKWHNTWSPCQRVQPGMCGA
jgi:hypothetical protein